MSGHPENSAEVNEMMEVVGRAEVIDVWCKGCEAFRPMNVIYAKYLSGEINNCSKCNKQ